MTFRSPTETASDTRLDQPPLVLFDGACPMCSREVAHYRRVRGADQVQWLDVANHADALPIDGIDRATAMARFHVRDRDGQWQTGAYGFAELWSHLRGYRVLSRIVSTLHLLPMLDAAYTRFARWRLRRQCDTGTCSTGGTADTGPGERL